jgi:16S rRNA (adenine1518-N6/adenine1519-N6)-dimethyltransferase
MGKNLGQHFLTNRQVVDDIVACGNITPNDTVIEIGPGKGVLTKQLVNKARQVVAVEKDPQLSEKLKKNFRNEIASDTLAVINEDIRDTNLEKTAVKDDNYKIIANIPYYLTSDILRQFLRNHNQPEQMVVLTQKEVAERITCAEGKHSRLSIFVHAYGNPELIKTVEKSSFDPPPNVTSAILQITNISRDFFADTPEKEFFDLVRTGFQHKRKQLKNNLSKRTKNPVRLLKSCDIQPKCRAEQLDISDWECLNNSLQN